MQLRSKQQESLRGLILALILVSFCSAASPALAQEGDSYEEQELGAAAGLLAVDPGLTPGESQPLLLQPVGYEQAVAEAKSRRLSGILIFGIGTGLGLATAVSAMTYYIGCSAFQNTSCSDEARLTALVGLGVTAVSVAVGVPLWVSGQRELTALRRQRASISLQLSPLPGGAAVGGRWQF